MAAPTLVATRILQNAGTTTAINTTGATTFVVFGMVYAGGGTAPALPTFTDSVGNTYTLVDSYTVATGSSSDTLGIWICKVGTGSASHTWSFSLGASGQFPVFCVAALSGCAAEPVDDHKEANYTASGTYSSGALTLSQANDLVLGFTGVDADNGWLPVAGSGYTLDQALNAADALSGGLEHQTFGSSGSQAATFTFSTTGPDMRAVMVAAIALKASGGSSGVTGTLNATLADATASAAGTVTTHGTLSGTLAAAVLAAAGIVAIAGSGGGTLGNATLAAAGTVPVHGTLSQTLGAATASGSGAVKVSGNLSRTLGGASLSASGTVISGRVGQLNATLADAALSGSGAVRVTGTASNTLGAAISAATGGVRVAGQLAATLAPATVTATGTATPGRHGALDATLAATTLSAHGAVATHGTLTQTLAGASLTGAGTLAIHGSAALTLDPATSIAFGTVPITGNLNATLAPATLVATGRLPGASLPPDPLYFIRLPARSFYAAAPARSFYVLSNPNMTRTFSAKDPGETVVITLDASLELDGDETLTQITGTDITTRWGTDADASLDVSDPQINGEAVTVNGITIATDHAVQAVASAGLDQCGYFIAITCNTSNPDKVLVLKGILPVNAQ